MEKLFLTNESKTSFLQKIKLDLSECDSFAFSVSFIKKAGLVLLQDCMERAIERGAHGQLITSTYQNFTDIPSLEVFLSWQRKYPNFETRLDFGCFGDDGFHTKGYLFSFKNHHEVVIGSSNITYFALMKNKEWDISLEVSQSDDLYSDVKAEFDNYWNKTNPLNEEIVHQYTEHLKYAISSWDMDTFDPQRAGTIKPNLMQREALKEISRYRDMNVKRALVVAATGSGKTYLAAFDALNFNAKKLLFIVHKDMILEEAQKTFMHVFGTSRTYGIYTGQVKDNLTADFLFATNIIVSAHLDLFDPKEFDYIIIDEVHHAAATTYRKIINYFQPEFLLGLTATPDRLDEKSVYDLFGKNVPYDLRLREAIENDLVVPFHYYGIKDSLLSYADDESGEGIRRIIQQIASDTHCEFVKEQIEKYRPTNGKLKCVGFCRTVEHARLMSENMSKLGYVCEYLSGDNSTGERIKAFSDLQDESNPLSIIFAVDILNEGIDVPSMNMVLFLRPTESSTIFIQQLGRGLRKYQGKSFLTVLDFIANSYRRSVQIAIGLGSLGRSGTVDKATARDAISNDYKSMVPPGVEIHFDKESKEEILKSIDSSNFNRKEFLKQDYQNIKRYLKLKPGEYPKCTDFVDTDVSSNFLRYVAKFGSYYDFLLFCEEDVPFFSKEEVDVIRTLSWYLPLVRTEDYLIIQKLLEGPQKRDALIKHCKIDEGFNEASFDHALLMLQNKISFSKKQFFREAIKETDGVYSLVVGDLSEAFISWLSDLLSYGLTRYDVDFHGDNNTLKLYGRYSGAKVMMVLNNLSLMHIQGVETIKGRLCLFINLNKDSQPEERLKYKDKFLSNKILQWEPRTGTTMDNKQGIKLLNAQKAEIFIRKVAEEDNIKMPFIYLGKGTLTNPRTSDSQSKAILFDIVLDKEIPDMYKYDFGIENAD